jgi:hypothetical protein
MVLWRSNANTNYVDIICNLIKMKLCSNYIVVQVIEFKLFIVILFTRNLQLLYIPK